MMNCYLFSKEFQTESCSKINVQNDETLSIVSGTVLLLIPRRVNFSILYLQLVLMEGDYSFKEALGGGADSDVGLACSDCCSIGLVPV